MGIQNNGNPLFPLKCRAAVKVRNKVLEKANIQPLYYNAITTQ